MNTIRAYADAGIQRLQQWYDPGSALWSSTNWWNAANALWVTIDYCTRIGAIIYPTIISRTFARHRPGKFLNKYYDDEGWWALTWLKAYDLTLNEHHLVAAQTIFADMETGWDNVCGGGIWWNKDRDYKNAVSNELFFTVAARLHQRAGSENERNYYLDWANRAWNWFEHSSMINYQHLINDGLRNCQNSNGTIWTYNQGIILGGLTEMYRISHDHAYLSLAEDIADATVSTMIDENGVLQDPCEINSDCGGDGPQFKGIFMRNLATLNEESKKPDYQHFMLYNAQSIIHNNSTPAYEFGLRWSGPVDHIDAARQSSALDALIVAMTLEQ
jgi:predicted alpha-1,6-mannanase (GH76 family)